MNPDAQAPNHGIRGASARFPNHEPRSTIPESRFARRAAWLAVAAVPVAAPLGLFAHLGRPSYSQSLTFALAVALSGLLVFSCVLLRRERLRLGGVWIVALAAQALSLAASIGISAEPLYALSRALLPCAGIVFFVEVVATNRDWRDLRRFTTLWLALGAAFGVVALLQVAGLAGGLSMSDDVAARGAKMIVVSVFGHPNHLASALVPILFIALSFGDAQRRAGFPTRRSKTRPTAALTWRTGISALRCVAMALIVAALLLTQTRGAWIATLAGLAVYGSLLGRAQLLARRALGRIAVGAVVAIGLAALLLIVAPSLGPRWNLRERLLSGAEVRSRLYSWLVATDLARERPLLGHGVGAYEALFWDAVARRQAGPSGPWFETTVIRMSGVPPLHAHNEFLHLAAEQGLFGVLAFGLLLGCGLAAAWRLARDGDIGIRAPAAAMGAGLVASLIDACFMFPYHLATPLSAMLFMLATLAILSRTDAQPASQALTLAAAIAVTPPKP